VRVRNDITVNNVGSIAHGLHFFLGNDTYYLEVAFTWEKTCYSALFGIPAYYWHTQVWVSKSDLSDREVVFDTGSNPTYRVAIYRNDNTNITVKIVAFANPDDTSGIWSFEREYTDLDPQILNETFEIWIEKTVVPSPNGYLEGWIWNEAFICNGEIIENVQVEGTQSFWDALANQLWSTITDAFYGLGEWAKQNFGFLGDLYEYLSFGLSFIVSLFDIVREFIPFFFFGYIIYLFGLIVSCVIRWDMDPLINQLIVIYQFFVNVINMIINVAQAIWNFIKIW